MSHHHWHGGELDHRVKNTLANIQALVTQTGRSADSLAEFTEGLNRRIRAMSRAHSLLTQSRWEGVSVASLVHEELDQYNQQSVEIAEIGPGVILTAKAALALSMALHELATNAAKYGSLSVPAGRVAVEWTIDVHQGLTMVWKERGGPLVGRPQRRGFGSTLIERALSLETGGRSQLHFRPEGVVCNIELPASAIQRTAALIDGRSGSEVQRLSAVTPLPPCRILVVEDSALVLMLVEDVIGELGWTVVGPAMRLQEALALARTETFDAALLDVNLDGEMSWEVAAILKERGIPFTFSTGYDGATVLPERFVDAAVINKPFEINQLERALKAMVDPATAT